MAVAFHSSAFRVLVATYFGRLFIRWPKSPSSVIVGQAAANSSYVTRPNRSASDANNWSLWQAASSSFQYGTVQLGFATTPSRDTYMTRTTLPIAASLRTRVAISFQPTADRYQRPRERPASGLRRPFLRRSR
jgi:hypothetical protein